MDNEPKMKLDNVKILSAEEGSYEWNNKTNKCLNLVVQDQKDPTKFVTGQLNIKEGKEADVEHIKKDAVVGPCWVYEKVVKGEPKASFFFPKEKSPGGGGKYGGGDAYSKQSDPAEKIVSMGFSYAKDIMLATHTGEWNWEEYFHFADQLAAAMMQSYKVQKQ